MTDRKSPIDLENHAKLLMDSYRHWTGKSLIPLESGRSPLEQLERSELVVLSHGIEDDPILNYGNAKTLQLWELDWETLTRTPSRLTAESMGQDERAAFMARVTRDGYVDNYTGVRISSTGRRFYIKRVTVWNVVDSEGIYRGQAAVFADYEYVNG
ncbi:MEKHLA domain-containing protein [Paenibacillus sp. J5C_2022]|uniref:MEKHLA domain-containing protein n=1 Tax=Paenibacillus sp. J5C2022 TaxID=2977129 RepID=UPI0021D2A249|nr:MEKHLA domain-containing protein [Paenibacillus sp. J5C2022]MCU6712898.1 MEKHLA domain-containing protein [Paenibacillus sp. J5C2022]